MAGSVVALATSSFGNARLAAAETEPIALIWNAPPVCPTGKELHDQVERSLAGSLKELAPVAAVVNVVEVSPGHWQADLIVHSHGRRAERQFQAESCEALAAAAALIIALAAEGADESSPSPAAREVRPAAPLRRPASDAEVPPDLTKRQPAPTTPVAGWNHSGLFLLFGGLLDGGTMPEDPAPGIEAAVGKTWTASLWRMRLSAGASYLVPQEQIDPNTAEVLGRYWLVALSGRGCLTAALSRFEIGPCLGGELVWMRGTGLGGSSPPSTQYWASPFGSVLAAFTVLPRVVLFARTDIVFPSTRRTFLSPQNYEVYTIPSHAIRGALGVELRFP